MHKIFRTHETSQVQIALHDVSFEVRKGETLGLVGESGSGKSTVGRCLAKLLEPTSGRVLFKNRDLKSLSSAELSGFRRQVQIVFQDPYAALNPRLRISQILEEPLLLHHFGGAGQNERRARVHELLEMVGLQPEMADRFPHEFSGGQRQRLGLARALAAEPELLICDEPVSALDLTIQAQILSLLVELRARLGLTIIFIAHDLKAVEHVSDRVVVLHQGKIVESGRTGELFRNPLHSYTQSLLASVLPQAPSSAPRR